MARSPSNAANLGGRRGATGSIGIAPSSAPEEGSSRSVSRVAKRASPPGPARLVRQHTEGDQRGAVPGEPFRRPPRAFSETAPQLLVREDGRGRGHDIVPGVTPA